MEHPLEGEFEFTGADGPRQVQIRAKADRIDLLHDGTLRVIDYKLGRAPKTAKALQLPIYGVCAEQHLKGRHGKEWNVSRAGYVAFKERNAFVSLGSTRFRWSKHSQTARSVWSPRSTGSSEASSQLSRKSRSSARGAATQASAGRITLATNNATFACSMFDVEDAPARPALTGRPPARRAQLRRRSANNVVLEASAGTGKTSVLVGRYVNLLKRGVDPSNILAITFTRKAAAEMRERILRELRESAARSEVDRAHWRRDSRSPRRHRDQHHRRVLPVAAPRVSARGGSRSRRSTWRTRRKSRDSSKRRWTTRCAA